LPIARLCLRRTALGRVGHSRPSQGQRNQPGNKTTQP
jgi:hypothetical protein